MSCFADSHTLYCWKPASRERVNQVEFLKHMALPLGEASETPSECASHGIDRAGMSTTLEPSVIEQREDKRKYSGYTSVGSSELDTVILCSFAACKSFAKIDVLDISKRSGL